MENCRRKERAEPYVRDQIGHVKEITSEWSLIQDNKNHVEQFLTSVSIDYSSQEIQEIREAVVELLTRYKDKINDREHYTICRIETGGSMREESAVWKYGLFKFHTGERIFTDIYTEFDYLGVLEKPCCYEIDIKPRKCCAKVKKSGIDKPCSCEVPNCSRVIEPDDQEKFDDAFKEELCKSVESLCDCYSVYREKRLDRYNFRQKSREQQQQQRGCNKCSVNKPTGQLHIDTEIEEVVFLSSYSLKLMWTSDAMTLVAPEYYITDEIKTTSPIKRLPILIDFLPALEVANTQKNERELEHECFLVPKRCIPHVRHKTWRLSGCVRETDHIVNKMSEKHRKCYKILKYICVREYFSIFSYHVKTSVLNHSVTCRDSSEDCRNCVTAVLKELKTAYKRKVLESFCYKFNLL